MELEGKRVAVLAENMYQEMELWYPVYRFREAGAQVTIVGPGTGKTFTSKTGYPVNVDANVADVRAADFDAVIVPGGYAPDYMRRSAGMVALVREANKQGKIVGAICHAGWMLCSADIVRGKLATSYFSIKDDMVNAGATWLDQEVVRDGNLITSRQPDDLPAFCREIIGALVREAVPA
ncbi:MAG TPA: type 1 glutamine amidotransferase domain-containing protein [Chloroflexota bacterium]|nr:type 1 glutamine amidotransferase domain-containing protein [Chloroflexota bacterium]